VSVEAISWALNLAPVPADQRGQPSSPCKFVLVGLANHAGPDGTAAFPSVATLVRYTGLSERTVRTCLDRLEAGGIIARCDPGIVAARIRRADRRPQGWDLDLGLVRGDLADGDASGHDRQLLGLAARAGAAARAGIGDGVQPVHPDRRPVDNSPDRVHQVHPAAGTGCNERTNGVQPVQPRGAAAAPEPYREPSIEPSAAAASVREALPADGRAGGGPAGEFFAALGGGWRLTAIQRSRLAPAVQAALAAGWTPADLAGVTGANTDGVRSPPAVLAARLSPAELPSLPPHRARPPWCGQCDERTRMLGFDGDAPARCPRCNPGGAGRPGRGPDHHPDDPLRRRGAAPFRPPDRGQKT